MIRCIMTISVIYPSESRANEAKNTTETNNDRAIYHLSPISHC